MKKKALFIGCGALALAAVSLVLVLVFSGGKKESRSIKVIELSGSLSVERDGKTIEAY